MAIYDKDRNERSVRVCCIMVRMTRGDGVGCRPFPSPRPPLSMALDPKDHNGRSVSFRACVASSSSHVCVPLLRRLCAVSACVDACHHRQSIISPRSNRQHQTTLHSIITTASSSSAAGLRKPLKRCAEAREARAQLGRPHQRSRGPWSVGSDHGGEGSGPWCAASTRPEAGSHIRAHHHHHHHHLLLLLLLLRRRHHHLRRRRHQHHHHLIITTTPITTPIPL